MARAAPRPIAALLLVVVASVMFTPLLGWAGAATEGVANLHSQQTVPGLTNTTVARPPSSSISTTPTTRNRTFTTRPRVTGTTTATTPAIVTSTSTTSTTVASIPAPAPAPVTLPLATATQSGSISAVFPILSGIGFFCLAALLGAQWLLTSPGRKGPTL